MKRHKHLFERVASLGNLLGAAKDALRGKRSRQPGAGFLLEFENELVSLHEELGSGEYAPGAYHYFTIYEPKQRRVAAAPFRDRVVHHAIVRVIQPLFERRFVEDSFASRPGKGTHAAMRRTAAFAQRYRYALKCDVRKYFPSIDHDVLQTQVSRVIGDKQLLDLLATIIDSHHDRVDQEWPRDGDLFDVRLRKRGLPIGNLTSQFLANVYLNPLDHFVKHELRVKGYARYLDDFVLFGDDRAQLKQQGERVKQKLAELRLTMHPDKYRLLPTRLGVDFAGYVVFQNGRIRLRTSTVRRFQRRYREMKWEVRHLRRPAAEVTRSVKAWVAHTAHAQSVGLRRAVLSGRGAKENHAPASDLGTLAECFFGLAASVCDFLGFWLSHANENSHTTATRCVATLHCRRQSRAERTTRPSLVGRGLTAAHPLPLRSCPCFASSRLVRAARSFANCRASNPRPNRSVWYCLSLA